MIQAPDEAEPNLTPLDRVSYVALMLAELRGLVRGLGFDSMEQALVVAQRETDLALRKAARLRAS